MFDQFTLGPLLAVLNEKDMGLEGRLLFALTGICITLDGWLRDIKSANEVLSNTEGVVSSDDAFKIRDLAVKMMCSMEELSNELERMKTRVEEHFPENQPQ